MLSWAEPRNVSLECGEETERINEKKAMKFIMKKSEQLILKCTNNFLR